MDDSLKSRDLNGLGGYHLQACSHDGHGVPHSRLRTGNDSCGF